MKWSFRFARVFGIDLRVHVTFLLIVFWGAMQGAQLGQRIYLNPTGGILFGVAAVLLLFTCVTLHELGHAVVAIRLGVPVRDIVLLPIGGIAFLSRNPDKPLHELLIAIAGPLVNVVILCVLAPVLWFTAGGANGVQLSQTIRSMLHGSLMVGGPPPRLMLLLLIQANVMLVLFNLIPAFPLDGGRVLRAILGFRLPWARATQLASMIGQALAVVIAVLALMSGNILTAVIAFFIFTGAGAESAAAQAGTVLATRRVGDAYNKFALTLNLDHRVSHVIEHILTSYQPDFAVMNRGKFQGVVTRAEVLHWLAADSGSYDVFVTEIMRDAKDVLRVEASLTLDEVVKHLEEAGQRVAAVSDGETYLGLVSIEDISEAQAVLAHVTRHMERLPPSRRQWAVTAPPA